MLNAIPTRMIHAGKRWSVTDTPTRLRPSNWTVPFDETQPQLYGWRLQGTDEDGLSLVFDVYMGKDGWHVHRSYD